MIRNKKFFLFPLLLLFTSGMQTRAQQHTLQVEVTNIASAKGEIWFALFLGEKGFPEKSENAYRTARVKAEQRIISFTFKELPAGNYALAVFHDENGDGKMNKNMFGVPKEAFGFSNNVKSLLRAPYFKECAFTIPKQQKIEISINYY